jgi:VRR-NUC domain/Fanconi anemia-associated nuclease SAP domain
MQSAGIAAPAAPFYYLENFEFVLAALRERDADLLGAAELAFMDSFAALPLASRALLVRLIMRKRTLFRSSQISYDEIDDVEAAFVPLVTLQWVERDPALRFEELFALLRKSELLQCLGIDGAAAGLTKPALFAALAPHLSACRSLKAWWPQCTESLFGISIAPLCERFRLMFFGNYRQEWSQFVIAHLGMLRYESVPLPPGSRPFESAAQIDDFQHLYQARRLLERGVDPALVLAATPARIASPEWLEAKRQRHLYRIGAVLEKAGRIGEAHRVYSQSAHPEAAWRQLRLYEQQGEPHAALGVCETALATANAGADHLRLRRARRRLLRRLGQPDEGPPETIAAARWELIVLELAAPAGAYSVERLAAAALAAAAPGSEVFYVENALMNALFGLLCWRALFAPVPGAFFHGFHREPADLHDAEFYARRRALFDECMAELDGSAYRETIRRHFELKQGIANPCVGWSVLTPELLELALCCLPAAHLKGWFTTMARDLHAHRAGFPDLIQFWPQQRRYRWVEVKGPGDQLQPSQRRCLAVSSELGIPLALCKVRWQGEQSGPATARAGRTRAPQVDQPSPRSL